MKSFLLLTLSLMTGCVASYTVTGCQEGWVEFNCSYRKQNIKYDSVVVERPNDQCIKSTVQNKWENKGRFSLYHDTENKKLKVAIKQLKKDQDRGKYECQFKESSHEEKEEVDVKVERRCQRSPIQTASTQTNITCDYPVNKYKSSVKFFCKENELTCEDILTTKSPLKSNERFTLTKTESGFTISIRHLSPSDDGVYWCGFETEKYRAALRQTQLEVEVPPSASTPADFFSTKPTSTSPTVQSKTGRSPLPVIIAVVVSAVLLVLVLILVFLYKRIQHSKNTHSEEGQHNKEDRTYEEIRERPQEPDSGTAIKTIYSTANFPTNPSSSDIHYYSNSSFKNISDEVGAGDTYSTINDNVQHPTYSTVNHPSGLSEDPCYSTLNEPQQP